MCTAVLARNDSFLTRNITSLKIEENSWLSQNIYFDEIKSFWELMIFLCHFWKQLIFILGMTHSGFFIYPSRAPKIALVKGSANLISRNITSHTLLISTEYSLKLKISLEISKKCHKGWGLLRAKFGPIWVQHCEKSRITGIMIKFFCILNG